MKKRVKTLASKAIFWIPNKISEILGNIADNLALEEAGFMCGNEKCRKKPFKRE